MVPFNYNLGILSDFFLKKKVGVGETICLDLSIIQTLPSSSIKVIVFATGDLLYTLTLGPYIIYLLF